MFPSRARNQQAGVGLGCATIAPSGPNGVSTMSKSVPTTDHLTGPTLEGPLGSCPGPDGAGDDLVQLHQIEGVRAHVALTNLAGDYWPGNADASHEPLPSLRMTCANRRTPVEIAS